MSSAMHQVHHKFLPLQEQSNQQMMTLQSVSNPHQKVNTAQAPQPNGSHSQTRNWPREQDPLEQKHLSLSVM
jgi:hypothetical protein